MEKKLQTTLQKIVLLSKQNPEFGRELRKALNIETSANFVCDSTIPKNLQIIRSALEIRGDYSIDYSFVVEERLFNQLIVDNLRMENAALNLQMTDNERFYLFCVNAFYQVENMINYYYYKSYPNIENLVQAIVDETKNDGVNGEYAFKASGREENVGDIPIIFKLNAFCNTFLDTKTKIAFNRLRQLRNEGEHRCMILFEKQNGEGQLYKFFKTYKLADVRAILKKLVYEIKKCLEGNLY